MKSMDLALQLHLQDDLEWQDCLTALAQHRLEWVDRTLWPDFEREMGEKLGPPNTEKFAELAGLIRQTYDVDPAPTDSELMAVFKEHFDLLRPWFDQIEQLDDGTWQGLDTASGQWKRTRAPQAQPPSSTGQDADWELAD